MWIVNIHTVLSFPLPNVKLVDSRNATRNVTRNVEFLVNHSKVSTKILVVIYRYPRYSDGDADHGDRQFHRVSIGKMALKFLHYFNFNTCKSIS